MATKYDIDINNSINLFRNSIRTITNKNKEIDYIDLYFKNIGIKNDIPRYHMYIIDANNKELLLTKKMKYMVTYNCFNCERRCIISLCNFLTKINRTNRKCETCANTAVINVTTSTLNDVEEKEIIEELPLIEVIEDANNEFNNMDYDYVHDYFCIYLDNYEYIRIKNKIISLENNKYIIDTSQQQNTINVENLIYYPIFKRKVDDTFIPIFYDTINDVLIKTQNIVLTCDKCNDTFMISHLHLLKNQYKVLCDNCRSNKKLLRTYKTYNIQGEHVTYSTPLQLKFINFCKKNNIDMNNGPTCTFSLNYNEYKFNVDYYIPQLTLIQQQRLLKTGVMGGVNGLYIHFNKCNRQEILKEKLKAFNKPNIILVDKFNFVELKKILIQT